MYVSASDSCCLPTVHNQSSFQLYETVLDKGSGTVNEDIVSTCNDMFVVCDGSTSIRRGHEAADLSGGKRAAELTALMFSHNTGSLQEMAQRANENIFREMAKCSIDMMDRESLWSTSFAALRFRGDHLEWAQSGDCMIVLLDQNGRSELLTPLPGHDQQTLLKWLQIGPRTDGTIHQVLAKEIAEVRRGMNRTYGVLNGEAGALEFVNYGKTELKGISDILLLSDGILLPSESPEAPPDLQALADIYLRCGLSGLKKRIRSIQRTDPRCCRYPRFKMYDDMSGIALKSLPSPYSGSIP